MKTLKISFLVSLILTTTACGGSGTAKTPDGDKINLTISPEGTVGAKTTEGILLGMNNSDSFYGVWRNDAETVRELRYQGSEAINIPTSGIATYKGDAVWISGYDKGFVKGGETTLNVDFDNKTVDGKIDFSIFKGDELRRDITLHQGNLSGAKFSGQASVIGNSEGRYEGALFGDGAKQAAGLVQFENNSKLDVSFGGQKQ
ncbi:transferrin-binding protein-like solute binding protein [Actinobacillus genomosp. 1]|uniref:transferrin-binding protein-like solute binding protein n=1 Tax=Actinobacillus genomosp. 1 TaxID=254839 RepID=UPI00244337A9|nr:transferrin-binding protein-like solute binding protein [Actinobacillus genomosp. 1]WGE91551.1 transferrin-binding protein-like solute binding protein [Actinobacillus genomosp. 1]